MSHARAPTPHRQVLYDVLLSAIAIFLALVLLTNLFASSRTHTPHYSNPLAIAMLQD